MHTDKFPCPACGFLTFNETPGSYELCDICAWEDCPVQLIHPLNAGGPNSLNLRDYQIENLNKIPIEIEHYMGFKRDPNWRPLTAEESVKLHQAAKENEYVLENDLVGYYWLKKV